MPNSEGRREEIDRLSQSIDALKDEFSRVQMARANELREIDTHVQERLREQDSRTEKKFDQLVEAQKQTHELLTGGIRPQDGVLMQLREVRDYIKMDQDRDKQRRDNQKWVIRAALGSFLSGAGMLAWAVITAWMKGTGKQ